MVANRTYSVKFKSEGLAALVKDLKQTASIFDSVLADSQQSVDNILKRRSDVTSNKGEAAFKEGSAQKVRIAQDTASQIVKSYSTIEAAGDRFNAAALKQFSGWIDSLTLNLQVEKSKVRTAINKQTPRIVTYRNEETAIPRTVMFNSPFQRGQQKVDEPEAKLSGKDRALVQVWRNEYRTFFTQFRAELKGELRDALQKDDGLGLVGRVISTPFNLIGNAIKFPFEATLLGAFSGFGEKLTGGFSTGFVSKMEKGMGFSLTETGEDIGDIVGKALYRTYEAAIKAVQNSILEEGNPGIHLEEFGRDMQQALIGSLLQASAIPIRTHKRIQMNKKALPETMRQAGELLINEAPTGAEIEKINNSKSITLLVGGVNMDPEAGNTEYVNKLLQPLLQGSHVVPVKNFWSNSKVGDDFKQVATEFLKKLLSNDVTKGSVKEFLKSQGFDKALTPAEAKEFDIGDSSKLVNKMLDFFESQDLPIGKAFESAFKGYNPDDILIAAKAMYYKQLFPEMPVNIVGTSFGGFNAAGAQEILHRLGYLDIKAAGITTPFTGLEFTGQSENFFGSIGTADPLHKMTLGSVFQSLLPPDFLQVVQGAGQGHLLAAYLANPNFKAAFQGFFQNRFRLPKDVALGDLAYLSKRAEADAEGSTDEKLLRTLFKGLGESTSDGYIFNVEGLKGLTGDIKKKANRIKNTDIKEESKLFLDFLNTLIEELALIEQLGKRYKPTNSLKKAAKVFPLQPLLEKYQEFENPAATLKSLKLQNSANKPFVDFKAKIKSEIPNLERTFKTLFGQKVEGYSYFDPASFRQRAEQDLGGLIGYMEGPMLESASPKQKAKAFKYISFLKSLKTAIVERGEKGTLPVQLATDAIQLLGLDLSDIQKFIEKGGTEALGQRLNPNETIALPKDKEPKRTQKASSRGDLKVYLKRLNRMLAASKLSELDPESTDYLGSGYTSHVFADKGVAYKLSKSDNNSISKSSGSFSPHSQLGGKEEIAVMKGLKGRKAPKLIAHGSGFIAMERLIGENLSDLFRVVGEQERHQLIQQVGQLLRYLHDKGFTHNDLATGNIIRTTDGELKAIDFQKARRVKSKGDKQADIQTTLTRFKDFVSLVLKLDSPEQIEELLMSGYRNTPLRPEQKTTKGKIAASHSADRNEKSDKQIATEYNNYLASLSSRPSVGFDGISSDLPGVIKAVKQQLKEYRRAIAQGQIELAKNLGENLLEIIGAVKQSGASSGEISPQTLGTLTRYQNEIIKGDKGQGRAQIGLAQLASSNADFGALIRHSLNVGSNVAMGLKTGVNQNLGEAVKSGEQLGEAVIKGAEGELEIKSPSRAFVRIGKFIVEGLRNGIKGIKNIFALDVAQQIQAGVREVQEVALEAPFPVKVTTQETASQIPVDLKVETQQDIKNQQPSEEAVNKALLESKQAGELERARVVKNAALLSQKQELDLAIQTIEQLGQQKPVDLSDRLLSLKQSPNSQNLTDRLLQLKQQAEAESDLTSRLGKISGGAESPAQALTNKLKDLKKQAEKEDLGKKLTHHSPEPESRDRNTLVNPSPSNTSADPKDVLAYQLDEAKKQRLKEENNLTARLQNLSKQAKEESIQNDKLLQQKQQREEEELASAEALTRKLKEQKEAGEAARQRAYGTIGSAIIPFERRPKSDTKDLSSRLEKFSKQAQAEAEALTLRLKELKEQAEAESLPTRLGEISFQAESEAEALTLRLKELKEQVEAEGNKNLLILPIIQNKKTTRLASPQPPSSPPPSPKAQPLSSPPPSPKAQPPSSPPPPPKTQPPSSPPPPLVEENQEKNKSRIQKLLKWIKGQFQTFGGEINREFLDKLFDTDGVNSSVDNAFGEIFSSVGEFFTRIEQQFPIIGRFKGLTADLAVNLLALFGIFTAGDVIIRVGQSTLETARKFEQLDRVIISTSGSAARGAANLKFVSTEAKRLSVDLEAAKSSYGQLLASAQGSALEGQPINQIFSAVGEAAVAKGLDKEGQNKAFLAISQMISKNKISSEELRQQLGEALPGALQTAARSLGITTAQLDKMLQSGELLATDFLPKFATQLSAENASGVTGAANTVSSSITRFNNALTELQVSLGQGLQPAQKLGLDGLAVVFETVKNAAKQLAEVLLALILLIGIRLVDAFLKSVAAGKLAALGISSLKDAFFKAIPAVKQFLAEMVLLTAAISIWINVYQLSQDSFKDINEYANASAKGLDNLARAYREAGKAASDLPSPTVRQEDLNSKQGPEFLGMHWNLDTIFRNPTNPIIKALTFSPLRSLVLSPFGGGKATQGEREYNDFQVNASNLISRIYQDNISSLNAKNVIADIQKIDRELEKVRSKRFDLLPGDREGLQKSIDEEQNLLADREKLLKVTSTIQSNFARDAESIKKTLEAIDRLPEGADTYEIERNLKNALNDIKKSQTVFDELISSVSRGISEMDRRMRDLNEGMAAFNEVLELKGQSERTNVINDGVARVRDPAKVQFDIQGIDRANLQLRVARLTSKIAQIERDLNSPAMSATVSNLGVDPVTVSSVQLDRMLQEGRSPSEQSALKAIKDLKGYRSQLYAASEQLATAGQQIQTTLREFTLTLIDFYTQLRRQIEDLGVETNKAIVDLTQQFLAANLEIESLAQSILSTNFKAALHGPLLTQAQRLLNGTNDAFEQYIQSLMGGLEKMFQQASLDTQIKQQIEQINNQITGLKTSQEDRVRALQRQTEDKEKEHRQLQRSSPSESFTSSSSANSSSFGGASAGNNNGDLPVPQPPPSSSSDVLPPPPPEYLNASTLSNKGAPDNRSQYRARIAAGESSGGFNLGDRKRAENNDAPYGEYQFRKSTRDLVLQRHGVDAWSEDKQQRDRAVDAWIADYGKEIGVNILKLIDEGNFTSADRLLGRNQFTSLPGGAEASPLWRNQKNLVAYGPASSRRAYEQVTGEKLPSRNAPSNPLNEVVSSGVSKLPLWENYAIASTGSATKQNIEVLEQKKKAVTDLTAAQQVLNDVENQLSSVVRQNQLIKYIQEQDYALQGLDNQLSDLNDKYLPDTPMKQHEAAVRSMTSEYRQLGRQLKNQVNTFNQQKDRFEETASALKNNVIPSLQQYQQQLQEVGNAKGASAVQAIIDSLLTELNFLEKQIPKIAKLAESYQGRLNILPEIFKAGKQYQQWRTGINLAVGERDKERSLNESGLSVLDAQANLLQSEGDEFGSRRIAKQKAVASENERYTGQIFEIDKDAAENPTKYTADQIAILKQNALDLNTLNLANINQQFKDLGQTITETGKGALTSFFESIFTNTESAGVAFRNMALSILRSIAQIAAQQVVLNIFGKATGGSDGFLGLFSKILGHADGGLITGEGTGTSDSIVRRLSNGEFVLRASAVQHWGTDFLHDLNAMRQPRMAFAANSISGGGNSRNVSNPTIVMNVTTPDANSFRRSESQIGKDAGELYRRSLYKNS